MATASFAPAAAAGAWDTAHMFDTPEKSVDTLVMTANYVRPRMIADLAQGETRSPYILLPASGDSKIFLCMAKGPAVEIRPSDLSKLISYLNPQRVVVLGDLRFVPDSYRAAIEPRFAVVKVESDNWYTNAVAVANLLERPAIVEKYNAYAAKLAKESGQAAGRAGGEAPASHSQEGFKTPAIVEQPSGDDPAPPKLSDAVPPRPPSATAPASGESMQLVPPEPELVKPAAKKPVETVVPK